MCERKDQDMRTLEHALQQQLADAGHKNAHLGERELVLASEQVGMAPYGPMSCRLCTQLCRLPQYQAPCVITSRARRGQNASKQLGCCCMRRHLCMFMYTDWPAAICLCKTLAVGT